MLPFLSLKPIAEPKHLVRESTGFQTSPLHASMIATPSKGASRQHRQRARLQLHSASGIVEQVALTPRHDFVAIAVAKIEQSDFS